QCLRREAEYELGGVASPGVRPPLLLHQRVTSRAAEAGERERRPQPDPPLRIPKRLSQFGQGGGRGEQSKPARCLRAHYPRFVSQQREQGGLRFRMREGAKGAGRLGTDFLVWVLGQCGEARPEGRLLQAGRVLRDTREGGVVHASEALVEERDRDL